MRARRSKTRKRRVDKHRLSEFKDLDAAMKWILFQGTFLCRETLRDLWDSGLDHTITVRRTRRPTAGVTRSTSRR